MVRWHFSLRFQSESEETGTEVPSDCYAYTGGNFYVKSKLPFLISEQSFPKYKKKDQTYVKTWHI
jgi:hypothetical protein